MGLYWLVLISKHCQYDAPFAYLHPPILCILVFLLLFDGVSSREESGSRFEESALCIYVCCMLRQMTNFSNVISIKSGPFPRTTRNVSFPLGHDLYRWLTIKQVASRRCSSPHWPSANIIPTSLPVASIKFHGETVLVDSIRELPDKLSVGQASGNCGRGFIPEGTPVSDNCATLPCTRCICKTSMKKKKYKSEGIVGMETKLVVFVRSMKICPSLYHGLEYQTRHLDANSQLKRRLTKYYGTRGGYRNPSTIQCCCSVKRFRGEYSRMSKAWKKKKKECSWRNFWIAFPSTNGHGEQYRMYE